MNLQELSSILPLIILVVWACGILLVDQFLVKERKSLNALLAALGLLVALGFAIVQAAGLPETGGEVVIFNGMAVVDRFAIFLNILFLLSGLAGVALAYDYLQRTGLNHGEYYVLLLFTITGMLLMSMAADLIIVILALELLSFPLYVLSAFARPKPESEEAGLKYFLLGAFSSSFVVYGIALVYGATGFTNLEEVVGAIRSGPADVTLLLFGAALILIGLAFKVAAVPFHMWTPDVYQGAPTAIVGFMSVGAKAGGFAGLLRVFVSAFPEYSADITPILWGIAALTMIGGNVLAIAQGNIKRLLAYSSIAHAGYILMGLVPYGQPDVGVDSVASALFYLVAYALTNFTAWAVVISLEQAEGEQMGTRDGLQLDDYAGLGRKYPALAAAMAVAMFSFTGIPPTLGFVGKFYLFRTALEGGFIGLALIGVLTSLISAYYYLRVVVVMYMRDGEPQARSEPWLNLTAYAAAVGTILLTVFSAPLFRWASEAVLRLF